MRYCLPLLVTLGLCALGASCDKLTRFEPPPVWGLGENVPIICVGLAVNVPSVKIEVRGPYEVYNFTNGALVAESAFLRESEVLKEKNGFLIGKLFLPYEKIQISPKLDGSIAVNGKLFRGRISILPSGASGISVVNHVNLEHYVASVIAGEMSLGWPEAALRAQAVAARTYALNRISNRKEKAEWDLTAGSESQVYPGLSGETDISRKVAQDTFGIILTYEGKLFSTYYHSTCGDSTVSVEYVFGEKEIPPLAGVWCRNCRESPYYRWTATFSVEEVVDKLKAAGYPVEQISDIRAIEQDSSGRAKSIDVDTGKKIISLNPSDIRKMLKIRSTAFSVTLQDNSILIKGQGWGHGVGMCQWGAYGMAKLGFSAEEILRHFYPESELVRLY